MTNGKRDYKKEERLYEKKHPERDKHRVMRNKARAMMEKKVGKKALEGKDVGHKKALSKSGLSQMYNLMVQNASANRSFSRNKDGSMKSEVSKKEKRRK